MMTPAPNCAVAPAVVEPQDDPEDAQHLRAPRIQEAIREVVEAVALAFEITPQELLSGPDHQMRLGRRIAAAIVVRRSAGRINGERPLTRRAVVNLFGTTPSVVGRSLSTLNIVLQEIDASVVYSPLDALAKSVVASWPVTEDEPLRVPMSEIVRAVSRAFDVSVQEMKSECRTAKIVKARQIGMCICRRLTASSLPAIGRQFGNRDHTTVLHALRKHQSFIDGVALTMQSDATSDEWALAMKAGLEQGK